ncbi:GNAT family N-acetyltransferase [Aestuariimicrobium kwangyangense]|uniref:GNAT family N-acetyltransferase n=1 Tax=Aestuariimicrobium kwangyangense TaxID=396389 RepID=UPI0003B3196F|nr:GNAT family N-acetyltransferase [Aestuariimicrobium kwangyangense]
MNAISDLMVEPMLEWSPLTLTDVDELAELAEACAWLDDPVDRPSGDQLREDLSDPRSEPERNGVVGRDRSGAMLAAGWLLVRRDDADLPRIWLNWLIHPQARHRQIGHHLVRWLTERGCEWGLEAGVESLWLGSYVDTKLTLRRDSLIAAGFTPERWFADMHLSFDEVDPHALPDELCDGVTIVGFDPERHTEQVRIAHNLAFADLPGAKSVGRLDWERSLSGASSRPEWSFVALEDDRVVGYALSSAYQQDWDAQGWSEGWTDRIGVLPSHRGRRLGQALLRRVLISFADAGLEGAGLGVDTGGADSAEQGSAAVSLFARLGYQEADSVVLYSQRCEYHDGVLRRVEGVQ